MLSPVLRSQQTSSNIYNGHNEHTIAATAIHPITEAGAI
jgi:hypothetical protein